jgi:hypothetical protein
MELAMPRTPTADLTEEIAAARAALIETVQSEPDTWWSAYDLKIDVRNGWSAGAMSLALNGLVADGTFDAEGDKVRLHR